MFLVNIYDFFLLNLICLLKTKIRNTYFEYYHVIIILAKNHTILNYLSYHHIIYYNLNYNIIIIIYSILINYLLFLLTYFKNI